MNDATKERPILFSGPMVRAILDGQKTVTRRIVKPEPPEDWSHEGVEFYHPAIEDDDGMLDAGSEIFGAYSEDWGVKCPYGGPGERLWVREAWGLSASKSVPPFVEGQWLNGEYDFVRRDVPHRFHYRADSHTGLEKRNGDGRWRPSIHMPRVASRIFLEITEVRVERVQDISEADAQAEGVKWPATGDHGRSHPTCIDAFASLWDSINGVGSWEANPYVWAVGFKRI